MELVKSLSKPLCASDVEVRVGTVTAKGVSLLLYKTARTDILRLNEVIGINWKREHYYDAKGLLLCKISVFNGTEWVGREDVGIESATQKQKGLYSDALKRAGFSWGIGAELYRAPFIFIFCETVKDGNSYKLKNKYAFSNAYVSDYIVVDNGLQITIKDSRKCTILFTNAKDAGVEAVQAYNAVDAKGYFSSLHTVVEITQAALIAVKKYPQHYKEIGDLAEARKQTIQRL